MSKNVFITGATGYIGGATLANLLANPSTKLYNFVALVRNKDKAASLEALGVRTVVASLEDSAILASEAEKADIVIHTASADHVPSAQAILSGMKKGGKNPIYIHVSGTSVLMDDARGEYCAKNMYSDLDTDRINALPKNALHRDVDLTVIGAASYARTHIVLPSIVYGIADHALVKAGISNPRSIFIPLLVRAGIDRGQGGAVGKGANMWSNIHIDEIASVIVTVLEAAVAGKTATGAEGYYFGESAEHEMHDVYPEVARVLSAHGIGCPEPRQFTGAEIKKYFGEPCSLQSDSLVRGNGPIRAGILFGIEFSGSGGPHTENRMGIKTYFCGFPQEYRIRGGLYLND